MPYLDEVQSAFHGAGAVAVGADAADDEVVAAGVELLFAGEDGDERFEFIAGHFDHLAALGAMQVGMLRVAIVVIVDDSITEGDTAEQARFNELGEGAVNGCPAGRPTLAGAARGFFSMDVLVLAEYVLDQVSLGNGEPLRLGAAGENYSPRKSPSSGVWATLISVTCKCIPWQLPG